MVHRPSVRLLEAAYHTQHPPPGPSSLEEPGEGRWFSGIHRGCFSDEEENKKRQLNSCPPCEHRLRSPPFPPSLRCVCRVSAPSASQSFLSTFAPQHVSATSVFRHGPIGACGMAVETGKPATHEACTRLLLRETTKPTRQPFPGIPLPPATVVPSALSNRFCNVRAVGTRWACGGHLECSSWRTFVAAKASCGAAAIQRNGKRPHNAFGEPSPWSLIGGGVSGETGTKGPPSCNGLRAQGLAWVVGGP